MYTCCVLAAVLLNVIFFALATYSLYVLVEVMFPRKQLASMVTLLWCIQPTSVFTVSAYSEFIQAVYAIEVKNDRFYAVCKSFTLDRTPSCRFSPP